MTEWEKLQNGSVYNDFDDELFQRRIAAKKLFRAYNKTEDDETDLRCELMHELFKDVGKNVWIEPDFRCEFGKNITIEDNGYINFGCVILDCAKVKIGANTLLGPNVGIYPVNHSIDAEESTDAYKKIYNQRTATERINNRILNDYGLHRMFIHT